MSICTLLFIEYFLFRSYAVREIIDFYPANFDQAGYLAQSYITHENILKEGWLTQFKNGLIGIATSYSFILQTVIIFSFFGASRLAALTLNFVYFAALQIIVVKVARDITQRYLFAFLMLGLLLSIKTPFYWAGGLMDFRIDFMAFCLYGIWISCLLKSQIFLDRKWTVITTLVGVYLILLRYIAATFIFGTLSLLFGLFLIYYYRNKSEISIVKLRIKNIFISGTATLFCILPFLWNSRAAIYHYYIAGHFLTNEKYIRAAQVGVVNFITNIQYYPYSIFKDHIGPKLAIILFISLLGSYIMTLFSRNISKKINSSSNSITVCLFFTILVPIIILTADIAKSPVVGGIVTIPLIWLGLWLVFLIYNKNHNNKILRLFLSGLTILSVAYGVGSYSNFMRTKGDPIQRASLVQISKMYDDIGNYMYKHGMDYLIYSSDHIRDFIIPQVLSIVYYEKHGVLLKTGPTLLGSSINEVPLDQAVKNLRLSNVFITNLNSYSQIPGEYPFDIAIQKITPDLQKIAGKEFVTLGDYNFNNSRFRVYVHLNNS